MPVTLPEYRERMIMFQLVTFLAAHHHGHWAAYIAQQGLFAPRSHHIVVWALRHGFVPFRF
jgi:hypothetical protein